MKYDIESIKKRKQKMKNVKKIVDIIVAIMIYNIILISLSCLNKIERISIFGLQAYIITTDSMEPEIKSGEFIIVKKVRKSQLNIGDVITFEQNGNVITHRIINVSNEGYTTKGDNNNIEDNEKIEYKDISGKVVIAIPILGKFFAFMENQILFLIIVLILLILYFYKLGIDEKKADRREKKEIEKSKKSEYEI